MSKRVNNNYSGLKNVTSTPRRHNKQKSDMPMNPKKLFLNSTEIKNDNYSHNNIAKKITQCETVSLEQKEPSSKTPKEILSFLLKNSIGKSLMKLEANTKEQEDTLKFIGKNFLSFEKNILTLKVGVEKKKKEDAKKKKLSEKKRSKTVQSNRRFQREYTTVNLGKNNKNNNLYLKTDSTFLKRKNDNLMDTTKIRSKTMRPSKSSNLFKSKKSNDLMMTPKKSNMKIIKNNENQKGEETSRTTTKDNNNDNDNNMSQRQPLRSKSRKRTSIANKEREKSRKSISRSKSKRKSISDKNKMSDEKNKIKNNINNLKVETERDDSPKIIRKEPEISNKDKSNNNIEKKEEESHNYKNVLKDLEDYNKKKPKLEEEKDSYRALRVRSRSKNRDRRIGGESNIDKEIKGSLIDVKHMIEGVSDVIDKIESDRKSRDKRKNDIINKDKINDDEKNKNNFSIKQSIKFGKESQIMNDEIINTITNDKNIMSNSILENNFNFLNKNDELNDIKNDKNMFPIPESDNDLFDSQIQISKSKLVTSNNNNDKTNDNNCNSDINNFIVKDGDIIDNNHDKKNIDNINYNDNNNDNNKENNMNDNTNNNNDDKCIDINNNKDDNIDNNNNIMNNNNNLENLPDKNNLKKEVENKINEEEKIESQKEIKEETITEKEQKPDNQHSILSQSAIILSEKYILISRDPNAPFTVENILKFDKTECLRIIDFLNFQEKMEFTGINHGFIMERINILNNKKEEIIKSIDLSPNETINDLITKTRLKYSNDELSQSFSNFQIARGGSKAVELLNNDLYSNIFKKSLTNKKIDEICIVYRVLLTLFGEYKICSISENKLFWTKCTEYMNENSEGKIGTFILKKFNEITFEHKKIVLINKLLSAIKNNFNASYFSKICGTTGLLIFIIRDALEYCGVIINEKKTQPARILDNLLYYKNCIDTLTNFADSLSTFKTYKIREKNQ